MKKKRRENRGLTVISLIFIIIVVLLVLVALNTLGVFKTISNKVDLTCKVISKQIDVQKEIEENEKLLGTTDVEGEGITISILDGKDLIHQEDLIILIDELKNSGSQAISVNEQRVTTNTYLYCDGTVILIDGFKIGNPFLIKAIGDKETIYGALTRNKGYLETLNKDGIEIKVEKQDNIKISKTNKQELYTYQNKSNIKKLYTLNQLVGKSDAMGKGVSIEIYEKSSKLTALSFLQIVNDLNSAGAKAISINGQRVTTMTDMMDISNTYVLINSIPIKGPYVVDAIGDTDRILEALDYNNSYITKTKSKGNLVDIYTYKRIEINKYEQKKDQDKMLVNYLN